MKIVQIFHAVKNIIPKDKKKKLNRFLYTLLVFSALDLISIAYLIPAILVLLDKRKLMSYFEKYHISLKFLDPNSLLLGILILVVLYVLKNLLQTKFNVRLYHFLYAMSHELSMSILDKYLKSDYLSFQQQNKGNLIQNITRVTNDFCCSLLGSLLFLVSESFIFLIVIIILLCFYFTLTLLALVTIGLFTFLLYRIKKSEMKLINETYRQAYANANAELLNILDGYIDIKSSGNHKQFLDKFKVHNKALNRVTSLLTSSSGNYSKYLELFLILSIAGFIFCNLIFLHHQENFLLVSVLGALSIKIVPSMSKILNSITMISSHSYSIDILNDVSKITSKAIVYNDFTTKLEFNNIHFGYANNTPLFEDLNFSIKRGKIIGIKGITGTGKTTFLHLVAGLLSPEKGTITIDGNTVEQNHFFPFISYVAQQPFLFNGTLLENITMRQKENTDLEYIHYLLENLELKELVEKMPNGLETVITHNSSKLSGGQKQRLALLRALYNKPKLLILDESTNQQNEELEKKLYTFIQKIAREQNSAIIIVSHNPVIYSFCDMVYTLENATLNIHPVK